MEKTVFQKRQNWPLCAPRRPRSGVWWNASRGFQGSAWAFEGACADAMPCCTGGRHTPVQVRAPEMGLAFTVAQRQPRSPSSAGQHTDAVQTTLPALRNGLGCFGQQGRWAGKAVGTSCGQPESASALVRRSGCRTPAPAATAIQCNRQPVQRCHRQMPCGSPPSHQGAPGAGRWGSGMCMAGKASAGRCCAWQGQAVKQLLQASGRHRTAGGPASTHLMCKKHGLPSALHWTGSAASS